MMPNTNQVDESAMAFLNFARRYHEGVEELFHRKRHLTPALNALYFHVVELLLKAYVRARNENPGRHHKIGDLYKKCRDLELTMSWDENIVNRLESGNVDMAFRYFSLKSGSEPDLNWTREAVGQLMQVVAEFVESKKDIAVSGVAVKLSLTLGKRVTQDATSQLLPA